MKRKVNDEYVLKICSKFIIADTSKIAHFAHLSIREYLQKRVVDRMKEYFQEQSHNPVAETCLSYLMDPLIPLNDIDEFDNTPLGYSVLYWAFHWQTAFENKGPSFLGKVYAEFIPGTKVGSPFIDWINVLPVAISGSWNSHGIINRLEETTSPTLAACVRGFVEILINLSKTLGVDFIDFIQEKY